MRKMEEVKELQEQVASLAHDKTQLIAQNQDLRASYQCLAAQLPQMSTDYE